MSSDHLQRQMDFIVEHQAKFEVSIAKLEDNLARLAEQSRENTANIAKLGEIILSLANYNEGQDERIAAHDRQIADNEKQIAALIEHGKDTDERINALIKAVERFYDGNGK
jgi:chromosome segregation ATPase